MNEALQTRLNTGQSELQEALTGNTSFSPAVRSGFLSSMTGFLEVFGDPWSVLLLRDSFLGVKQFGGFQRRIGVNRQTLSRRLGGFVDNGILLKERYHDRPVRYQYQLTKKGLDLYDFALNIWRWQNRWLPKGVSMLPSRYYHTTCGNTLKPVVACAHCGEALQPGDVLVSAARAAMPDIPKFTPRARRWVGDPSLKGKAEGLAAAKGTSVIGDRWSCLILAAVMMGIRSFDELIGELGVASNTLSHRLEVLRRAELLTQASYDAKSRHFRFCLTQPGEELFPVFLSISQWSDRWLSPTDQPLLNWHHVPCGHALQSVVTDESCGERVFPNTVSLKNPVRV